MKYSGKKRWDSVQLASFSRLSKLLQAPAVYEDPYCSVAVDGAIYVSEYYLTSNSNATHRLGNREVWRFILTAVSTVFFFTFYNYSYSFTVQGSC